MQAYKNLFLIGTSHISVESVHFVEKTILEEKPSLVALELDSQRFVALRQKKPQRKLTISEIRQIGIKGYLFARFGEFIEHKLGDAVGVSPGSEMLKAAETAGKEQIPITFIDQPIQITLKRLSNGITWKEKFRFVIDLIKGPFQRKKYQFDLRKVPEQELIRVLLADVKKRYPNVYRVLVDERNRFMARHLFLAMQHETKIVAVVGAGHEEEIIAEIKKFEKR
ncbi:TraB/GumN family protein [Candidatus Woesearchaeota archaeon]|nr:TraB/GumN family protein [Candidatus Woesearchaeota archaeon]